MSCKSEYCKDFDATAEAICEKCLAQAKDFDDIFIYIDIDWERTYKPVMQIMNYTDEKIAEVASEYRKVLIGLYPNSKEYIERNVR